MATRGSKQLRARKDKGQSSNAPLPYPPALPLDENQLIRLNMLENHRELQPSRWICRYTLGQLGLTDTIQMLTDRLGLWDFLCDEVDTYEKITIEFLSSYEFDRGTRIMTFNLGGYSHSMHTTELMEAFGLSTKNLEQMRTTIGFFPEMNEHNSAFSPLMMSLASNGSRMSPTRQSVISNGYFLTLYLPEGRPLRSLILEI